jgi:hypothetical protein
MSEEIGEDHEPDGKFHLMGRVNRPKIEEDCDSTKRLMHKVLRPVVNFE